MEKLKVLGTSGLNYYLENLLQDAKEKIILITPYIKLDYRIKEILKKQKKMVSRLLLSLGIIKI